MKKNGPSFSLQIRNFVKYIFNAMELRLEANVIDPLDFLFFLSFFPFYPSFIQWKRIIITMVTWTKAEC
jgi:hypothetical protein